MLSSLGSVFLINSLLFEISFCFLLNRRCTLWRSHRLDSIVCYESNWMNNVSLIESKTENPRWHRIVDEQLLSQRWHQLVVCASSREIWILIFDEMHFSVHKNFVAFLHFVSIGYRQKDFGRWTKNFKVCHRSMPSSTKYKLSLDEYFNLILITWITISAHDENNGKKSHIEFMCRVKAILSLASKYFIFDDFVGIEIEAKTSSGQWKTNEKTSCTWHRQEDNLNIDWVETKFGLA